MKEQNYFTKEQIEMLKDNEHYFYTAVYENYKRASSAKDNDKIADLYEEVTGGKLNRNWSCGHCVLTAYKVVGKLYFESKERLQGVDTETEPKTPKTTTKKKVANKGTKSTKSDTGQEENTQKTSVPDETQEKVLKKNKAKQTKSKGLTKK